MAEDYAPLKRKYEDQPSGIELAKQRANGRVGVIVGKGGETIKYLQLQSGAKIQITRDIDADPNSSTRMVELMGTPDAIAESGGSGIVTRRLTGQAGSDEFVMKIPNNKVGLIIGKGGETIKNMQASTGARIQVILLHLPLGDTSTERTLKIDGTPEQIEPAKQLVY
ncbi:Far upstream element-binding protein 2 [Glycine soja]|nr:Far upstream element-binding protein 2 [Glycine soja]